ncbi:uncharacterized protein LOC135133306 isoform X3 [Zophobas morio]|uniref:uncharacterized protein LOC135133306 isoform X3 n=1 Tax=Zophobas morio TaxID=2755281 RepID=UPI003082C39E
MSNKGALALLADYEGNSSDEEAPSRCFSTKRLHRDEENEEIRIKRVTKLPAPNFIINNPEEVVDDPSLHDGRIRSFAHERGNWVTYAYIPYESNEGLQRLMSLVTSVAVPEDIELKCFQDLHLSLTRTVILRYHWIDSFVSTLRDNLSHFTKFIIMLDHLEVYTNEEKTRTFIGLQVKTGYDALLKLVHCLDNCLGEFKLPKFYENPSFHISIAWCLGDNTEKLKSLLPYLNRDLELLMSEYSQENWYTYVEQILCKTGALALLADYEGNSSDEEAPSRCFSTKRLHRDEENEEIRIKRVTKLPAPIFIINNPEEVVDDPSLHDGRIRSFAHERGNWVTYAYIPCLQRLMSLVTSVAVPEDIELKCFQDLHLSLTRTVILRYHWIDSFVSTLRDNLSHFTKFIIMLDHLEVYTNEEKTRTFIGLQVKTGYDTLLKLVHCLDNCLGDFKLPKFYENPSFHISIAWCLGDNTDKLKSLLPYLNRDLELLMSEYSQENWYTYVEQILCKTAWQAKSIVWNIRWKPCFTDAYEGIIMLEYYVFELVKFVTQGSCVQVRFPNLFEFKTRNNVQQRGPSPPG